jgi:hypothetical protein
MTSTGPPGPIETLNGQLSFEVHGTGEPLFCCMAFRVRARIGLRTGANPA